MWDISHKGDYYVFSLYGLLFGHRQIDDFRTIEQWIEQLVDKPLNEHEYIEFLVGRDGEFDQLVTAAILRCKKRLDSANCSVTWVMPYLKSDYIKNRESYDNYYDFVRSAISPLRLTRNPLFKSETERWLNVPICAFSTLRIKAAALIKRYDMQKKQIQILSIFVNDSIFRLQFCISV